MNLKLKVGLLCSGSALLTAGVSAAVVYKLTKKYDLDTIAGIHSYYGDRMQEKRDVEHRLNAFVEVIDTLDTETYTRIMTEVNEKLSGGPDTDDDEAPQDTDEIVDDETAKQVKTVTSSDASGSAMDRSRTIGIPYHTIYKSGSSAIVEPARGIVAADVPHISPAPEEGGDDEDEDPIDEQETNVVHPYNPEENYLLSDRPFLISATDCGASWHDVECLTYYDGDVTLVDSRENAVNIDDYIGNENLDHFVDGLLYVRNDRYGMDYEVRWSDASFQEVAGLDPDAFGPTREKIPKARRQLDG